MKLFPAWVNIMAFVGAFIYFLAQAELLATVIPGFPVWDLAGFIGSTVWLTWLLMIGIGFIRGTAPIINSVQQHNLVNPIN